MARIYLDNAATSWPKPEAVYRAVDDFQRRVGAPSGRSGYAEAVESSRLVERARAGLAELIGVADPRQIALTYSGTDSLNLAIRGVVRPGDHVVATDCEHNSVLRPLKALAEQSDVEVSYARCDGQGFVSPDEFERLIRPTTRLVAVVHGSNVTGAIQPVEQIAQVVRERGALLLVDAAQTLGHVPIDVGDGPVDLLAAPCHKGLLGPLGTGMLYIRPGVERELQPLRRGGTGSQSDEERQPETLPDKYEPGNHNLPGLAGLVAALDYLKSQTIEELEGTHSALVRRLLAGLREVPGLTVHGPAGGQRRTSVVSVTLAGYDPQELALTVDASHGVQCRAGLHCAPRMHASLHTTDGGGTVRLSPGYSTTFEQIDATVAAFRTAAESALG
jgi:cysteine desulfurase family protein